MTVALPSSPASSPTLPLEIAGADDAGELGAFVVESSNEGRCGAATRLTEVCGRTVRMRRAVTSARASLRLAEATRWLDARGVDEQVLVIGASRAAASELIREVARTRGSGFGWHRITLGRLAAEIVRLELAGRGLVAVGPLPVEALCVRVLDELRSTERLGRLAPVADQPGLPRSLARTLTELRMAGARGVAPCAGAKEIDAAARTLDDELARAALADRAFVFETAIAALDSDRPHPLIGIPTVLVDVPVRSRLEQRLLAAVIARAPDALATVPAGDDQTLAALAESCELADLGAPETDALGRVQRHLFDRGRLVTAELDPSIEIYSAPGEHRECVELARRVVHAAAAGVPFDRMAVVLRSPTQYRAHLEEALGRAGVPVCFERGTVRPDPSGRAFLALLACAAEDLSARRFAEYVSLGEVPAAVDGAPPAAAPADTRWIAPDEELSPIEPSAEPIAFAHPPADYDLPVAGGTLRAPSRWERLLVEAAVIGSRERWDRRLAGLEARLSLDDDGATATRVDLAHLRSFALPLLDDLCALPREAAWSDWLDRLGALATRALRAPDRVLEVLSELAPLRDSASEPDGGSRATATTVSLREVQLVLHPRLVDLIVRPTTSRYGRLLVVPVEAIRGLAFDVVFVPGLAERMFPQKVIEDPLLLDHAREQLRSELGLDLATRDRRIAEERLALRLAIGAARTRAVLSYPRIDLDQGRPRVPSFYGLEVIEAAEGALPGFDELGRRADATGGARIGWPAPDDRMEAIDEAEHDLALLDNYLRPAGRGDLAPKGAAAYLLDANPHLARSLRTRARRWTVAAWLPSDGLIATTQAGKAALAAHAMSERSFSATALEQLAPCPYRFALRTIARLEPRQQPEAIETLGPLERGSLIHDIQFELLSELRDAGQLPIASVDTVRDRIDGVVARVAERYRDELCPAIDRVWDDGIVAIAADVREWVRRMVEEPAWQPRRFELAFGLPARHAAHTRARDPSSVDAPAELDLGAGPPLSLRGSIDLVEEDATGALRATDYKTGRARVATGAVIAGGTTLQPVLYALALERLFPDHAIAGGRLYFCTSRGEFAAQDIALDDRARDAARVLATTLADHFARGFFPAAPDRDACAYCDYRPICGPYEELRLRGKRHQELVQLRTLRGTR